MARIPDEVLAMHILSRLPVEIISRFRCVSKDWRNLFETPSFIKQQLKRSIENNNDALMINAQAVSTGRSKLFSVEDINSLISNEYSPLKSHELNPMSTGNLWGSCNGFVCILGRGFQSLSDGALCIYNPSTTAYKKLPTPTINGGEKVISVFSLSGYGFGYDSKVEDYKLVVMMNGRDTSRVGVYTLGTNSWKDLENFTPILPVNERHGVLANETIHWLVFPWSNDSTHRWVILSFDLRNETFQQAPPPKPVDHAHPYMVRMCSFEGSLCLIVNEDNVYLDIWVKKDYGVSDSSWAKLFTIACQPRVDGLLSFVKPLKSFKNGEILMLLNNHALVLYDPETESLRTLKVGGGVSNIWRAEMYPRSVVSVSHSRICTSNANSEATTTSETLTREQDAHVIRPEQGDAPNC